MFLSLLVAAWRFKCTPHSTATSTESIRTAELVSVNLRFHARERNILKVQSRIRAEIRKKGYSSPSRKVRRDVM